eukprot:766967-Hanusia_phi.AAC.4
MESTLTRKSWIGIREWNDFGDEVSNLAEASYHRQIEDSMALLREEIEYMSSELHEVKLKYRKDTLETDLTYRSVAKRILNNPSASLKELIAALQRIHREIYSELNFHLENSDARLKKYRMRLMSLIAENESREAKLRYLLFGERSPANHHGFTSSPSNILTPDSLFSHAEVSRPSGPENDDDVLDRYIQSVERKTDVLSRQLGDVKYSFEVQQQRFRELHAETRRIEIELNHEKSKFLTGVGNDDVNMHRDHKKMRSREISVAPQELRMFEHQNHVDVHRNEANLRSEVQEVQKLNRELEDLRAALSHAEQTLKERELQHQSIFSEIFCQKEDLENENFVLKDKLTVYERNLQNLAEMLPLSKMSESGDFNKLADESNAHFMNKKESSAVEQSKDISFEGRLDQSDGGRVKDFFARLPKANENLACQLVNPSSDMSCMNAGLSGQKIFPVGGMVKDLIFLTELVSTIVNSQDNNLTRSLLFKKYNQKAMMIERLLSKKDLGGEEDDNLFENLIRVLEADLFDIIDSIWQRNHYFEHVRDDVKLLFENVRLSMMLSMKMLTRTNSMRMKDSMIEADEKLFRSMEQAEKTTSEIEDHMKIIFRQTIQLSSRAKLEKIRNFALLGALRQSELYEHQITKQTKNSTAKSDGIAVCSKCKEREVEIATLNKRVVSNQHVFAILRANLLVLLEEFTRFLQGISFREEAWDMELKGLKKAQNNKSDHQDTIDLVLKIKNVAQRMIKERLERSPVNKSGFVEMDKNFSTQKEVRRLESSLLIMQEQKLATERGMVELEQELLQAKVSLLEAQNSLRDTKIQHSLYQKKIFELQLKVEQDAVKFQNKELEISNLKKYHSMLNKELLDQHTSGSPSQDAGKLQKRLFLNERRLSDARMEIARLEESHEIYEEQSKLKLEGMAATIAVLHDELNQLSSSFMDCERSLLQESRRRRQLEVLYAGSQACQKNLMRGSRDATDKGTIASHASTGSLKDRSRSSPQRRDQSNDMSSVQKELNSFWHDEVVQSKFGEREGIWKRINDSLYSNENAHLYPSDTESNLSLPSTYDKHSTNIYVQESAASNLRVLKSPTASVEKFEASPPGTMMHYLQARGRES